MNGKIPENAAYSKLVEERKTDKKIYFVISQ